MAEMDIWKTSVPYKEYDVKIADDHIQVRFTFYNRAMEAFALANYLETSSLLKLNDKIYFRAFETKDNKFAYKIMRRSAGNSATVSITPIAGEMQHYQTEWCGRVFELQYDDTVNLYYIDLVHSKKEDK